MRWNSSLTYSIGCLLTIFSISNAFCSSPRPLAADPTSDPTKSIEMASVRDEINPKTLEDLTTLSEIAKTGKVARAVAFPGGGIRGIIQAGIAKYIEERTGHSFSELFHMMSGTSTGGIIAAALSAPSEENPEKARMKASEIEDLYMQRGKEIFKEKSFFEKLFSLFTSKYSEKPLEKILYEMCGDLKLSDAINDLMITIYNRTLGRGELLKSHFAREAARLSQAPSSSESLHHQAATSSFTTSPVSDADSQHTRAETITETVLASSLDQQRSDSSSPISMQEEASSQASSSTVTPSDSKTSVYSAMTYFDATLRGDDSKYRKDYYLSDVERGTTAAPSFFKHKEILPIGGSKVDMISAVDGGLFANDPTLFTLIEMFKIYPNADAYFLLTIGNGSPRYKEKPVKSILDIAMQTPDLLMANNSTSQRHIMKVLGPQYNKPVYYHEIQMHIPQEHAEMDDVSTDNMQFLQRVAREYTQRTPLIDMIIDEILALPRIPRSEIVISDDTPEVLSNFHMMR